MSAKSKATKLGPPVAGNRSIASFFGGKPAEPAVEKKEAVDEEKGARKRTAEEESATSPTVVPESSSKVDLVVPAAKKTKAVVESPEPTKDESESEDDETPKKEVVAVRSRLFKKRAASDEESEKLDADVAKKDASSPPARRRAVVTDTDSDSEPMTITQQKAVDDFFPAKQTVVVEEKVVAPAAPVVLAVKKAPATETENVTTKPEAPLADVKDAVMEDAGADTDEMEDSDDAVSDEEPVAEKKVLTGKSFTKAVPKVKKPVSKGRAAMIGTDISYAKYDPLAHATWKAGEKTPFMFIAKTFTEISKISGRIMITNILANMFRTILMTSPDDLLPAVYLCTNRIAPAYMGEELGVGDMVLVRAVADATGRTTAAVKQQLSEMGDLGQVALASRARQGTISKPQPLTVDKVFKTFKLIASDKGHSSMGKKQERIKALLVACSEHEATFIIRALQGKLRIGSGEQTVLVALGHAFLLSPTHPGAVAPKASHSDEFEALLLNAADTIKTAYAEMPNYDVIIKELRTGGLKDLHERVHILPGIPLKPMLAKPTKGVRIVLDRFADIPFTCEYKYDGERAQIHRMADGKIKIYSRNLEDHTEKYPDLVQFLPSIQGDEPKSFILDSEVVAYDLVANKILPFQTLSTRARKGVVVEDVKVQVCIYAFDLLFYDEKSLLREPFEKRRDLLRTQFNPIAQKFGFATSMDGTDEEQIQSFLTQAVENNCEGLMVKTLREESTYEASKRSNKWLKLKKDYMDGLTDSLDLVPIGAFFGRGKRTGTYGAYLLACYDDENEEFQSICKIGTGFSDEALEEHTKFFKQHVIPDAKNYYRVDDSLTPDVWFDTKQVWEVLAADLSISPKHRAAAGLVDNSRGIALRFPRFIRIREDKNPEDATSARQVAEMYKSQATTQTFADEDEDD